MKINIVNLTNIELPRAVVCSNDNNDELFLAFGSKSKIDEASLDNKYLCFTDETLSNNKYMICDLKEEVLNNIIDTISFVCNNGLINIDCVDIYNLLENTNNFIVSKGVSCDNVAACELAIKQLNNFDVKKIILHITYNDHLMLNQTNEIIEHFRKSHDKNIDLIFGTSVLKDSEEYIVSIIAV